MKWLSIVWYKFLPPIFGGQKGIAFFNQELGRNIPGICLCSADNEPPANLSYQVIPELPVGKKQFLLPVAGKKIIKTAIRAQPTHIILEHPYHGKAARKACKLCGAKLILHAHNIESERFRETGKHWSNWVRRVEKKTMRHADLILFKKKEDLDWAVDHLSVNAEKCMLIPYGIDKPDSVPQAEFLIREKYFIKADEKILLFAGTLDYLPNAKAVENIYSKIAPALAAAGTPVKIIICGRNKSKKFRYLEKLSHPLVIQAGEVDDIGLYFSAADIFINPVETGGGIQTKTIEALSYHCDVVSFRYGSMGIDRGLCGKKMKLSDNGNWDTFNQFLLNIESKTNTPQAFFEHFNQASIIKAFVNRLNKL